jgi:Putative Ig domain
MNFMRTRILSACLVTLLGMMLGACGGGGASDSTATAGVGSPSTAGATAGSSSSTSSGNANHAPKISGTPATTIAVGTGYSFAPVATDSDGNTLAFSISNKPAWATFNTSTGRLTGTPTAAGTFANIVITVSDGAAAVALASFSINVTSSSGSATLSWVAPTTNVDGTPLTDLAGYIIYYGTSSSNLSSTVSVDSSSASSYTIAALVTGRTYYFAIASMNAAGISSNLSSVASKTI